MRGPLIRDARLAAWPNGMTRDQSIGNGGWPTKTTPDGPTYSPTGMVVVVTAANQFVQTGGYDAVFNFGMQPGGTYRLHIAGTGPDVLAFQVVYKSGAGANGTIGNTADLDKLVTIPADAQGAASLRIRFGAAGTYTITQAGIFPPTAQPGWWQPGLT